MEKTNDIIIDFNQLLSEPKTLATKHIEIQGSQSFIGFKKSVAITYHRLFVDEVKGSKSLKITDLKKFINIRITQSDKSGTQNLASWEHRSFRVQNWEFPFDIILNPSVVKDFLDLNKDQTKVTFTVKHQRKSEDSPVILGKFQVVLHLKKALCKVVDHFYFTIPELESGFEYRVASGLHIANREIMYKSRVFYADYFDLCEVKTYMQGFVKDAIYLEQNVAKVKESNPSAEGVPLRELGEEVASDLILHQEENRLILKNLKPNNKVTIPVYLDLTEGKYQSPLQEKPEEIISELQARKGEEYFSESRTDQIIITPDTRTTRLMKVVKYGSYQRELSVEDHFEIPQKYQWIPEKKGTKNCFSMLLGNHAESNNGKVTIDNLNIDFKLSGQSSSSIYTARDAERPVNENGALTKLAENLFEIKVTHKEKEVPFSESLICENEHTSFYEIGITFRHDEISDIPNDVAKIECKISFEYTEEKEEELIDKQCFESTIIFNVEKNPGSYWLAVDYGTSACVAAFSNGDLIGDDRMLIDLQKALQRYIKQDEYNPNLIEEFGTKYLSSTTVLREDRAFKAAKYDTNSVLLSPKKTNLLTKYPIPYLKSMIGLEEIPDLSGTLADFQYIHEGKKVSFKERPPQTQEVLRLSYYSLLSDFVEGGAKEVLRNKGLSEGELNKVVFTIPNTFTPKHISYIKDILSDKIFQNFKQDYITFLSESDAVACNYIYQWNEYNANRADKQQYQQNEEYVLIYDMGAGTLDLTYFHIHTGQKGRKDVEIIGKLGKATAGNYLDYLLGKAVVDQHKESFQFDPMESIVGRKDTMLDDKKHFKGLVRNQIKPKSNGSGDYELLIDDKTQNLFFEEILGTYEDLTASPTIREFLDDNTHTLIENFFNLFQPKGGGSYVKGDIPLNTVVFTGRSMQFEALQGQLKEVLIDWSGNPEVHFVDDLDASRLKNVVVSGALQYALLYRDQEKSPIRLKNKNLQARYGVLYQDPVSNLWKYKNLLDPSTRPINESPVVKDGLTIYEYSTDIYDADPGNDGQSNYIDMTNTPTGWFVQSYARDTAGDMNAKNSEYITKIEPIFRNSLEGSLDRVKVGIKIDGNNEMHLSVGGDVLDPQAPLRIDLENSETFKKSMWPYL